MTSQPTAIVADDGKIKPHPHIVESGQSVRASLLMMDNRTTALGDAADRDAAYEAYVRSLGDGWRITTSADATPFGQRGEGVTDAGAPADAYDAYIHDLANSWKGNR